MYKIFLDKPKMFECDIKIEGAALDKSEVRLILETENFAVTFKGKITPAGTVKIPINKLKGILQEDYTGKISLEVIAEDTVFKPWESQYHTDISKKVEVKIDESIEEPELISKPKISFTLKEDVDEVKEKPMDISKSLNGIFEILKTNKVSYKALYNNPVVFNQLIEKYCKTNSISDTKYVNEIKKQVFNIIKQ
jgi:hypothetical protein